MFDIGADDQLVVRGVGDGDGVESSLLGPVLRVDVHDGDVVCDVVRHLVKKSNLFVNQK